MTIATETPDPRRAGFDAWVVAAAVVGWLLLKPSEKALLTGAAATGADAEADEIFIARHDVTGAAFLENLGFPPRVCRLVGGHVQAKRYLVATDPAYAAALSPGSTRTLHHQGGPMTAAEAAAFEADPDHALVTALRRWDEGAKVLGREVPTWESWLPIMARVLAAHRFAPFSAQAGGPFALDSVLPAELRGTPGQDLSGALVSGPGYVIVRNWLSMSEIAALRTYASVDVPAMPAAAVFHTFERAAESGAVVPSRTEKFAHVEDAACAGRRFMLRGRLAELCSALRGGRDMVLYKEKVNYKLRGGTGGYLPHQDYYHGFDAATGARGALLPDQDVCVCMVAIDDMDEGNGAPEVAPGWHLRGPMLFSDSPKWDFGTVSERGGVVPEVFDVTTMPWTMCRLKAGDALIYGNLMPHRSGPNPSERDRRALFAIYSDAKHGANIRSSYYMYEAEGRRKAGSSKEGGKANVFHTGVGVVA